MQICTCDGGCTTATELLLLSYRGLSRWQPPVRSAIYAALSTPIIWPEFRAFERLYIWICPMRSGQEGRQWWEEILMRFLILFHKCFHILLIFWKTFYYVPGHISHRWVESVVHLQRHYSMDIVVLLWVLWTWYTFPALFLIHGSWLGACLLRFYTWTSR